MLSCYSRQAEPFFVVILSQMKQPPLSAPKHLCQRLWSMVRGNRLVLENFLSLGLINVLNSSFHLIIYPILIHRVGAEAYGEYVYAFSIVAYFITLVTYGLDMIGTRYLARYDQQGDLAGKSDITSLMLSSRLYLLLLSFLLFLPIVLWVEVLATYRSLLWASFLSVVACVLMPNWYFIGIQRTRIYLYIQIAVKVLLAVAIILWVLSPDDMALYVLLASASNILSAAVSFVYLIWREKLSLYLVSLGKSLALLREATPLFLSYLVMTVKSAGLNLVIGSLFGMTSLTGYDFSMKIVSVVMYITKQLNVALFPSVSTSYTTERIRKILRGELLMGIACMAALMLMAKPIIWIMGNGPIEELILPVFLPMTALIPIWLISGFFIELVLTANGRNREVFINQLLSLAVIALGALVAVLLHVELIAFVVIVILSGLIEIAFLYATGRRRALI